MATSICVLNSAIDPRQELPEQWDVIYVMGRSRAAHASRGRHTHCAPRGQHQLIIECSLVELNAT